MTQSGKGNARVLLGLLLVGLVAGGVVLDALLYNGVYLDRVYRFLFDIPEIVEYPSGTLDPVRAGEPLGLSVDLHGPYAEERSGTGWVRVWEHPMPGARMYIEAGDFQPLVLNPYWQVVYAPVNETVVLEGLDPASWILSITLGAGDRLAVEMMCVYTGAVPDEGVHKVPVKGTTRRPSGSAWIVSLDRENPYYMTEESLVRASRLGDYVYPLVKCDPRGLEYFRLDEDGRPYIPLNPEAYLEEVRGRILEAGALAGVPLSSIGEAYILWGSPGFGVEEYRSTRLGAIFWLSLVAVWEWEYYNRSIDVMNLTGFEAMYSHGYAGGVVAPRLLVEYRNYTIEVGGARILVEAPYRAYLEGLERAGAYFWFVHEKNGTIVLPYQVGLRYPAPGVPQYFLAEPVGNARLLSPDEMRILERMGLDVPKPSMRNLVVLVVPRDDAPLPGPLENIRETAGDDAWRMGLALEAFYKWMDTARSVYEYLWGPGFPEYRAYNMSEALEALNATLVYPAVALVPALYWGDGWGVLFPGRLSEYVVRVNGSVGVVRAWDMMRAVGARQLVFTAFVWDKEIRPDWTKEYSGEDENEPYFPGYVFLYGRVMETSPGVYTLDDLSNTIVIKRPFEEKMFKQILIHEWGHMLGFDHPEYKERWVRVPALLVDVRLEDGVRGAARLADSLANSSIVSGVILDLPVAGRVWFYNAKPLKVIASMLEKNPSGRAYQPTYNLMIYQYDLVQPLDYSKDELEERLEGLKNLTLAEVYGGIERASITIPLDVPPARMLLEELGPERLARLLARVLGVEPLNYSLGETRVRAVLTDFGYEGSMRALHFSYQDAVLYALRVRAWQEEVKAREAFEGLYPLFRVVDGRLENPFKPGRLGATVQVWLPANWSLSIYYVNASITNSRGETVEVKIPVWVKGDFEILKPRPSKLVEALEQAKTGAIDPDSGVWSKGSVNTWFQPAVSGVWAKFYWTILAEELNVTVSGVVGLELPDEWLGGAYAVLDAGGDTMLLTMAATNPEALVGLLQAGAMNELVEAVEEIVGAGPGSGVESLACTIATLREAGMAGMLATVARPGFPDVVNVKSVKGEYTGEIRRIVMFPLLTVDQLLYPLFNGSASIYWTPAGLGYIDHRFDHPRWLMYYPAEAVLDEYVFRLNASTPTVVVWRLNPSKSMPVWEGLLEKSWWKYRVGDNVAWRGPLNETLDDMATWLRDTLGRALDCMDGVYMILYITRVDGVMGVTLTIWSGGEATVSYMVDARSRYPDSYYPVVYVPTFQVNMTVYAVYDTLTYDWKGVIKGVRGKDMAFVGAPGEPLLYTTRLNNDKLANRWLNETGLQGLVPVEGR